jgi:hypothetical protein
VIRKVTTVTVLMVTTVTHVLIPTGIKGQGVGSGTCALDCTLLQSVLVAISGSGIIVASVFIQPIDGGVYG